MNDDPNVVVPTVDPTPADPKPADPKPAEPRLLTQEEVNQAVVARVQREREAFAKSLGLEAYDKAKVEAVVSDLTSARQKAEEAAVLLAEKDAAISTRDKVLLGYEHGIAKEKIDEAVTLAELKMQKDSTLTLATALEVVTKEYPNLTGVKTKAGLSPNDNVVPPADPFITPALAAKYPFLVKNKK